MEVFKLNMQQHPEEKFTTYAGLARGYTALGDKENAIKNWETALQNVPETQRPNLPVYQKALQDLKGK
jgi:predicted negative regulator of RcsB-dependent stress response